MNQKNKPLRQYFKVGDKIILNDGSYKVYGEVIEILPDLDIVVNVETEPWRFEKRRFSKRGYTRTINLITGEFSLETGIFPACIHEDSYLALSLFFNEQLEKKAYEQD
jgi:hypothetical protein